MKSLGKMLQRQWDVFTFGFIVVGNAMKAEATRNLGNLPNFICRTI